MARLLRREGRINLTKGQGVEMGNLMPQIEDRIPGHIFPDQNPGGAAVALATRTPKLKIITPDKVMEKVIASDLGKEDIVTSLKDLSFVGINSMSVKDHGTYLFDDKFPAFEQLCNRLQVPSAYLRKCPLTGRAGRNEQLEYWRDQVEENEVMLRVRGFATPKGEERGLVRAVLTKNYEPIDNLRLLNWTTDAMTEVEGLGLIYANVNNLSTHLRLAFNEPVDLGTTEAPDIHYFGMHISDSEVGERALNMDYMLYRLACLNGLIVEVEGEKLLHQKHIFVNYSQLERNFKDAFSMALDYREQLIDTLQATRSQVVRDPFSMIRRIVRHYRGTMEFANAVIAAFEAEPPIDGQATRYHIVNALTRAAKKQKIDQRYAIEEIAGKYLVEAA